jgi:hypothetical protein
VKAVIDAIISAALVEQSLPNPLLQFFRRISSDGYAAV